MVAIRGRASEIVKQTTGDTRYTDVNYVFPTFITTRMPIGLVGLMIAAIFAAAMSASAGELNSLASATVIDFYRRHFVKDATDTHYLNVSKLATIGWGLFACVVAMYAANQGSLIEVVNRYGSFFYGSLLGVFVLAILVKRATAAGAFWGLIAGMAVVLTVAFSPWTRDIAFLWHNLIGAVVVVVVGNGDQCDYEEQRAEGIGQARRPPFALCSCPCACALRLLNRIGSREVRQVDRLQETAPRRRHSIAWNDLEAIRRSWISHIRVRSERLPRHGIARVEPDRLRIDALHRAEQRHGTIAGILRHRVRLPPAGAVLVEDGIRAGQDVLGVHLDRHPDAVVIANRGRRIGSG